MAAMGAGKGPKFDTTASTASRACLRRDLCPVSALQKKVFTFNSARYNSRQRYPSCVAELYENVYRCITAYCLTHIEVFL